MSTQQSGNFSVLQEGSTLIKDHKTAVDGLNDVLAATTTAEAKEIALAALKKIGEPVNPGTPEKADAEPAVADMTTREG